MHVDLGDSGVPPFLGARSSEEHADAAPGSDPLGQLVQQLARHLLRADQERGDPSVAVVARQSSLERRFVADLS